jgi:hypothetical protein
MYSKAFAVSGKYADLIVACSVVSVSVVDVDVDVDVDDPLDPPLPLRLRKAVLDHSIDLSICLPRTYRKMH